MHEELSPRASAPQMGGVAAKTEADRGEHPAVFTAGRENGHRRPRGYAPWRPQARTRALIERVEKVIDDYEDHLPLTVRQIFYRLVADGAIEKTEQGYARLADHLVRARRAKLIAFDVIRDDALVSYSGTWHGGPEDFWDDVGRRARGYRRDRQAGQRRRLELWCEAAGMAPQLARVADEYSVPVHSAGGFASLTAVHLIAQRALRRDVPTVLLHAGDFDPSGESIFESIAQDAAAFVEADRTIMVQSIIPVRVALTANQVGEHGLPTAPPKPTDSRAHRWAGQTCQLEALAPDLLAEVVVAAISGWLDREPYQAQVEAEHADRQEIALGLPAGSDS